MQKPLERWPPSSSTSWPDYLLPGWGPLLLSEGQGRGKAAAWPGTQKGCPSSLCRKSSWAMCGSCPKDLLLPPHGGLVGGEAPRTPPQANR